MQSNFEEELEEESCYSKNKSEEAQASLRDCEISREEQRTLKIMHCYEKI